MNEKQQYNSYTHLLTQTIEKLLVKKRICTKEIAREVINKAYEEVIEIAKQLKSNERKN